MVDGNKIFVPVLVLFQPLHKIGAAEELMASIVFITREIFPVFHKWRYYDFSRREQVGEYLGYYIECP